MESRRLALVVAAGREPALLCEALQSMLAQGAGAACLVVVVLHTDCGQTRETAQGYRAAYPDEMRILLLAQSGEGAARNAGIRYLLESAPDVDAALFLDAEDRMAPASVEMLRRSLDASAGIGWFWAGPSACNRAADPGADWSDTPLLLAFQPVEVKGVLARREVLESGVRFEDTGRTPAGWAFCMAALRAGHRGTRLAESPILPRALPDTTLSSARRQTASHPASLASEPASRDGRRIWITREHEEQPRFLLVFADTSRFVLFTDPLLGKETNLEDIEAAYFASLRQGERPFAPFVVITTERKWKAIVGAGLAHFILWDCERRTAGPRVAALTFMAHSASNFSTRSIPLQYTPTGGTPQNFDSQHDLMMLPTEMLRSLVALESRDPAGSTRSIVAAEHLDRVAIRGPADLVGERPILTIADFLDALCERLRRSRYAHPPGRAWFSDTERPASAPHVAQEIRDLLGGGVRYPLVKKDGVFDVGFVTPFFDFGGVERVTAAVADVLRRAGFRTHLFVVGTAPVHFVRNALRAFDTINWLPVDDALGTSDERYFGTARSAWSDAGEKAQLVGLLSAMDVVINEHSGAAHEISGELRRLGVALLTHEHVVEVNDLGRSHGPPFRALAHSRSYDKVLTCSRQLADWMAAMGIARCKLLTVQNGAGFMDGISGTEAPARSFDFERRPMRLLYLGRFDRQKGVDRLLPVLEGLEGDNVACELRIIGKAVVDAAQYLGTCPSNVHLYPPVYDDQALRALYNWADVVLIPSRYEGLPLTIAEAQQNGAIVIATDVGAVSEGITTGENGFVFPEETYIADTVAALASLARDPETARRISARARADAPSWDERCRPLLAYLGELLGSKSRAEKPNLKQARQSAL